MFEDGGNDSYNPTMEKFIQSLLSVKNIACHLMEDVKLNVNGKHIFEVLAKSNLKIFVRKLALQMVLIQAAFFPLKNEEEIAEKNVFSNFETKAVEHFCSQTLMAMTSDMFNIIRNITPDVLESNEEIQTAAKIVNDQLIGKFLINNDEEVTEDPTEAITVVVKQILNSLKKRWPAHGSNISKMVRFLEKDLKKDKFTDKALIQLSNMLAFLITKPELVFHYAPHLALNERLCVHLADNFEINRLNTKVNINQN